MASEPRLVGWAGQRAASQGPKAGAAGCMAMALEGGLFRNSTSDAEQGWEHVPWVPRGGPASVQAHGSPSGPSQMKLTFLARTNYPLEESGPLSCVQA